MKKNSKEYSIEQSPFYNKNMKLRISLNELEASNGQDIVLARKVYYKQDDYVKLITTFDLDITLYHNLSSTAKTALYYILANCLEFNNPTFRFIAEEFRIIIKLNTTRPVFKAIKDLIDAKYIARTQSNEVYWINFNYFYKGVYVVDKYVKQKQ